MIRLCFNRILNNPAPRSATILAPSCNQKLINVAARLSTVTPNCSGTSQALLLKSNFKDQIKNISSLMKVQSMSTLASEEFDPNQATSSGGRDTARNIVMGLERAFARFEDYCQRSERVDQRNFVRTFDVLTRAIEKLEAAEQMTDDVKSNLSVLAAILIRCCGSLMMDTSAKERELLAGNLWHFIKEKKLPLDISHYNGIIRALNENSTSFDPQKFLDEITDANLTPDRVTYQRLIHQYCVQGNIDGATKLLEVMKDFGMELNELTFASLIIGYSKQDTPPSTKEMFELMRSNGIEPNNKSYSAAILSQVNLLEKNPTGAAEELASIYQMMEKDEIQFTTNEVIDIITQMSPHKDVESASKILGYVAKTNQLRNINDQYRLCNALFSIGAFEDASKLYWSHKPSENAIRSSNLGNYYIRLMANPKVPVDFAIRECTKLKEKNYNKNAFQNLFYNAAKSFNPELVRATLEKMKIEEGQLKCQFYWPLMAQAKDQEELISVLKNDFDPRGIGHEDLLDTFSYWVWPKFADEISKLFEVNKKEELNYDSNVLISSLVKYAIQENKIMDAIKFISEADPHLVGTAQEQQPNEHEHEEMVDEDDERDHMPDIMPSRLRAMRQSGTRVSLLGRLLDQIAEHTKDPSMVEKAFNMCFGSRTNLISKDLVGLVKVHLMNDDFPKAMETFLNLAQKYRLTPCKKDLITHCLEKKDPENLQKIMNISSEIHGEMNSLFDLAVSCLQCGKLKQAQKIFTSPGFRVSQNRVYETCRSLSGRGNLDILENYVSLTRDMHDINQEQLYQILINTYERTSNPGRVLDLWTKMQEEDFHPSKRSLLMIARVLEKNNIKVPFQKPVLELRNQRDL